MKHAPRERLETELTAAKVVEAAQAQQADLQLCVRDKIDVTDPLANALLAHLPEVSKLTLFRFGRTGLPSTCLA